MIERVNLDEQSRPILARHAKLRFNEPRKQWVILAPERLLEPDDTAVKILQLCDGKRRVSDVVDHLAGIYTNVGRDQIAADVMPLLQNLADKGFLEDRKEVHDDTST